MYITIRKEFFDNNGTEYACAVDMNNIKVHKKFDSAMEYHQKFFEEFRSNYGEFITNSPQIIWEGKNMIMILAPKAQKAKPKAETKGGES